MYRAIQRDTPVGMAKDSNVYADRLAYADHRVHLHWDLLTPRPARSPLAWNLPRSYCPSLIKSNPLVFGDQPVSQYNDEFFLPHSLSRSRVNSSLPIIGRMGWKKLKSYWHKIRIWLMIKYWKVRDGRSEEKSSEQRVMGFLYALCSASCSSISATTFSVRTVLRQWGQLPRRWRWENDSAWGFRFSA